MATEKWIAGSGVGFTWTAAITGSTLNSLANGNALLSDVAISNQTALDIFADIDFIAGGTVTTVAPGYLGIYLYPLLSDGSSYGDGRFGSAAAGPPPACYGVGSMGFPIGASTTMKGSLCGIIIPPGTFKFVYYSQAGVAFPSSGNTSKYRTYDRSIV